MDKKTGRIYEPDETRAMPAKTLAELEPLTRAEAAALADGDPTQRVALLASIREALQAVKEET